MTEQTALRKWEVFKERESATVTWVASPLDREDNYMWCEETAYFPTHAEAIAHVQAKQVEQAVKENPAAALLAVMAVLAAAEQAQQLNRNKLNV